MRRSEEEGREEKEKRGWEEREGSVWVRGISLSPYT